MIRSLMKPIVVVVAVIAVGAVLSLGAARLRAGRAGAAQTSAEVASPKPEAPELGKPVTIADFPDVVLTNQHGKPVSVYRDLIKDRAVAMSFIFTRCTTICPPLGLSFSRLEQRLGPRAGKDVNLISVSLDPGHDTPEVLRAWGEKYGSGPGWTLLTGSPHDVERLLKALGVFTAAKEDHAPVVLLGNGASGEWVRAHSFTETASLVAILDRMLVARPRPSGAGL